MKTHQCHVKIMVTTVETRAAFIKEARKYSPVALLNSTYGQQHRKCWVECAIKLIIDRVVVKQILSGLTEMSSAPYSPRLSRVTELFTAVVRPVTPWLCLKMNLGGSLVY